MKTENEKFLEQFDGYVILSHFERFNKHLRTNNQETVHYWMVTITLTSGDVKFYVKAITQEEANKKALEYAPMAEHGLIREFKLLP